jgi:PKD repeat protein/glucose/arabinose dehydrogenase
MIRWSLAVPFCCVVLIADAAASQSLQPRFQESVVFTGLTNPTAIEFASDGRVFVAEKRGIIKVFDDIDDTVPDIFADLSPKVHNYWDRGLLGLALHPDFPNTPHVYVLYTLDAPIGGAPPRWKDACPSPPGPTADGCVVGARLSQLTALGNTMTGPEQVFIEDWCQQYPGHSIGSLVFGRDGALYVSGGDGASFLFADYGQDGNPLNPCGDPPAGVGGTQTPPTAEGGALRAQDLETVGDPVAMNGAILRLDPITGQAMAGNPLLNNGVPDDDRIVAYGFRNPFRITARPNTDEIWVGDVGWNAWEEINRLPAPATSVLNFGWPCYEGNGRQSGYDGLNLNICESLYARPGAVAPPYYSYNRNAKVVAGETCPTGSSAVAGLAFYQGGAYPSEYDGAFFFADYNRDCIWAMLPGTNGDPDPANRLTFVAGAANPVQLTIGLGGDLFYPDFDGGTIRRIQYGSPTADATAEPAGGPAPLTVDFDGSGSTDAEGQALQYTWDLDGDGVFGDATIASPTYTYTTAGDYTVRLRVTDTDNLSDTTSLTISVGNSPPTAQIDEPSPTLSWRVGQQISFSGSATDPEDGSLTGSQLTWTLVMRHCPSNCHEHVIETFVGVASGSFTAPDHEYPSHLELRLTAEDSAGATDTTSVSLYPETVTLSFATNPTGLNLTVGSSTEAAPFQRTVIIGSQNLVSAPSPQSLAATNYTFSSWSDGGAQSHTVVAPATPTTYTATYQSSAGPTISIGDVATVEGNAGSKNLVFTVSLSAASSQTVTLTYASAGGTATAGSDYVPASGQLSFAPGVVTRTVTFAVTGDTIDEVNETFFVNLSAPANATIADGQGLATITDNDTSRMSVGDRTVVEGHAGTVALVFTVSLSVPNSRTVTVNYATGPGSANSSVDYQAASGPLRFDPGVTSQTVTIQINGDTLDEADETFFVLLSNLTEASLADGSGRGTILDDDPPPSVSIGDVTLVEGNSGTRDAIFTVTLTTPSGQKVTVNYQTADGTATNPADYLAKNGAVTFNPGVASRTFSIKVNGDTVGELDETFFVNLTSALRATIADGQGAATIVDNDP